MRTVYRSRWRVRIILPLGAVATLVWIQSLVHPNPAAGGVSLAVAFMVVSVMLTWRACLAAARVHPWGMLIANPLRSERLTWREIDRFDIGPHPWVRAICAFVVEHDGKRLPIAALVASWPRGIAEVEAMVGELNVRLERARAQESASTAGGLAGRTNGHERIRGDVPTPTTQAGEPHTRAGS